MNIKVKKRILSLMLAICLISAMMPAAVFAAETGTGKAIQLVDSGTAANIVGGQADNIYFGTYQQSSAGSTEPDGTEGVDWIRSDTAIKKNQGPYYYIDPIKWRVLENADGQLFLLSDQNLDVFQYHTDWESVTWENSTMRSWLNGYVASENTGGDSSTDYTSDNFIGAAFSEKEQESIAETTVVNDDNPDYSTEGGNNTTDKIFLLSIAEARSSSYFADNSSRISTNTAYVVGGGKIGSSRMAKDGRWWLRSPGDFGGSAAGVGVNGGVDSIGGIVNIESSAARPAFLLDLNSVLFTSAAVGGKSSGAAGADALTSVSDYTGNEWKLTLLDNSRSSFTVDANEAETSAEVGYSGWRIPIAYSGAQTGANEYVSALLCDSSGNVLYYGNIAQNSASGTASINIPAGLAAGSYSLKVFSEQCNGDYKTDYASAFQEISLNVLSKEATPQAVFTAADDNSGTLSNVDASMKYSTDGGASWTDITSATAEITGVTADKDIQVVKKGDGTATVDSDAQIIDVTQAAQPAGIGKTDCKTAAQNDGTITGVDSTMEYRLSEASYWTGITGTTVTGLLAGTYEVRIKASGAALASPAATVTISEYVAPSTPSGGGTVISKPTTSRISGDDRFETAVEVADQLKKELGVTKFNAIVVAYSDEFADALSASAFAYENEAPVLVVNENSEEYVREYIEQNLVKGGKVYIMGGNAVVTERFEDSLSEFNVSRLGGSDRYETNLLTLKQLNLSGKDTIIMASGLDYADALSASSTRLPVMIVGDKLTESQIAFLNTLGGDDTYYIAGGTAAVSSEVEKQLKSLNLGTINRLAGEDRYETSILIARTFYSKSTLAYLASGDDFPDGLTGGVLAGLSRDGKGASLLLVNEHNTSLAASYIEDAGVRTVKAISGTAAISDETLKAVI